MLSAVSKHGSVSVVSPTFPRLDASVADEFKAEMKVVIDGGVSHVVIDFAQVQFMDSSGLGALVGCLKYMGKGGVIDVANPSESVRKVLTLTRMNKVFNIVDQVPSA